jgi:cation/acetate symporter
MRGTTYNQAIQGIVLWSALMILLAAVTISYFNGNLFGIVSAGQEMVPPVLAAESLEVVNEAEDAAAAIEAVRAAMPDAASAMTPGVVLPNLANQISLVLALAFGALGLPHILMRFYTVQDARAAQKSAELTIWGLATFYAAVLFVGLAAMYVLYPTLVQLLADGQGGRATNMALPMLSEDIGGQIFLGVVAAGAMAAMISTATGVLISMTGSLAHDLYANILKPNSAESEQLVFAKVGAGVLTALAIVMSIWLKDQNVAVLVSMVFGVAASTFAPVLLTTLWWKRVTIQGIVAGMGVGLVVSLFFTFAKFLGLESVAGLPTLTNPALYSIPAALLTLIVVTYLTKTSGNAEEFLATAHRKH